MGGDNAPEAIIEGALLAAAENIPTILVGLPDVVNGHGLPVIEASEVIAMDDEAGSSVRTKKDSSLVRCAEAVRDGQASAMVSAGNTGATMASALLRMKRLRGVSRPAIATLLPQLAGERSNVMLDAGANADCTPDMLAQFARMGTVFLRSREGVEHPRVGLLSIGEEASKGNMLVKETHKMLAEPEWQAELDCTFIGNVEGRDLLGDEVDVIVTDGFTGNVALKSLEGTAKALVDALLIAFASSPEAQQGAELLLPALTPLYKRLDPDSVGGAALVGVRGVCIISHGSSSPTAVVNALRVARDLVADDMVGKIGHAVSTD